jgi:hypothetical protein
MADFKISFKITGHWPNWEGWKLIDDHKKTRGLAGIDKTMFANPFMVSYINDFYKQNFWDVNSLDKINDQQIANTVYDFGVNAGTGRAAKYLQEVVGAKEDGKIGADTLKLVNTGNQKLIYSKFNALRLAHYMEAASQPGQHQFLASWESRLKPYIG